MLVGSLLVIAGITFTAMEIKTDGSIDLKSPFISGRVQAGLVGISLIMFGTVIVLACLFFKQKTTIEVKVGGRTVKYAGYVSDRRMLKIKQFVVDLVETGEKHGIIEDKKRT